MAKANATSIGIPDLTGQVAIVTGGKYAQPPFLSFKLQLTSSRSRGMGFHIVQQLAIHGAKVYMAARSESSAKEAIARIESQNPELRGENKVVFLQLDLSSLKASRSAAERFLESETKLHILGALPDIFPDATNSKSMVSSS